MCVCMFVVKPVSNANIIIILYVLTWQNLLGSHLVVWSCQGGVLLRLTDKKNYHGWKRFIGMNEIIAKIAAKE